MTSHELEGWFGLTDPQRCLPFVLVKGVGMSSWATSVLFHRHLPLINQQLVVEINTQRKSIHMIGIQTVLELLPGRFCRGMISESIEYILE